MVQDQSSRDEVIVARYRLGLSMGAIAAQLGLGRFTVERVIATSGLTRRRGYRPLVIQGLRTLASGRDPRDRATAPHSRLGHLTKARR